MPKQVTKDVTPEEIRQMAQEYQELLSKANVPMKVDQTIADMERRAAEMNNMSVEEWKRKFEVEEASEAAAPAPKKKAVKKADRGAVTEIDRDYFFIEEKNQQIADTWMKLRIDMGVVMNLMVIGPSGCGKTELLQRLGREYGIPTYKIDCAAITTPDKWVGHKELVSREGMQVTEYVKSQHLQWLGAEGGYEPGMIIYDEINRLSPPLLNYLIPVFDGSQKVWIPDLGIYQEVHPKTMIAATANLGVGYSGTHSLDIALQDRFGVTIEATFPPEEEEKTVLMRRTGIDEAKAKVLVNIARQCRAKADDSSVSKYVSTRSLIDAAMWVQSGMRIADACDATFVKKFSGVGRADSERHLIEQTVAGMAGQM